MTATDYAFSNSAPQAPTQLDCLQTLLDPHTRKQLRALDIRPGHRCWDIGAGGGSTAAHLADVVGPTGLVVATDKDTTHLDHLTPRDNVVVHQHDIRDLPPPPHGPFDLITARLVLLHLPERLGVLHAAVQALHPGGRILVEEFDCTFPLRLVAAPDPASGRLFRRVTSGIVQTLAAHGASLSWAQEVDTTLHNFGLTDITTTAIEESWRGATPGCLLHETNSHQLQPELLDAGLTGTDLDRFRELMHDTAFNAMSYKFVSVHARTPDRGAAAVRETPLDTKRFAA